MDEIPEGFEPYIDEDGDQVWLDEHGARQYIGPSGDYSQPRSGWKRLYVGPPPPRPKSLEDRVRDLAREIESFDNGRGEGAYFAEKLRELLS